MIGIRISKLQLEDQGSIIPIKSKNIEIWLIYVEIKIECTVHDLQVRVLGSLLRQMYQEVYETINKFGITKYIKQRLRIFLLNLNRIKQKSIFRNLYKINGFR